MKEILIQIEGLDKRAASHGLDRGPAYWNPKLREEVVEWEAENPEDDFQAWLLEGADVFIAWFGKMRAAGVSTETAFAAVALKCDILSDRMATAEAMPGGIPFEERYQMSKRTDPSRQDASEYAPSRGPSYGTDGLGVARNQTSSDPTD